ncbi:MAG: DMT family transporter [Anaerostipes sp.]|nr:DMT family transporter [Anaerostipes sp.]
MKKHKNEKLGYVLVFLAGLLWGTIGVFMKEMSRGGASALYISFLRVAFAFIIMLLFTFIKGGWTLMIFNKKQLLFSAMLGIVCHGIYNIFYSYAVTLTGVSVSAVLLNVAPAITMFTSVLLFGEQLTRGKMIAVLMNIIGCTLTATGGTFSLQAVSIIGIACGVGAGISYAMTAILGRFAMEESDVFAVSTYSYLFAALFLVIPSKPWNIHLETGVLRIVVIGFLLALIPTAMAYVLYYRGLRLIEETTKVPVIASCETIVAAVLGVVLYQERLNAFSVVGILFVLSSIALMNRRKLRRT